MTESLPPHAIAAVDQWKAEIKQRLDVAIEKLREGFVEAGLQEGGLCGPVHTFVLMRSIQDSHAEKETMAALLAEAMSRLMDAEAVES